MNMSAVPQENLEIGCVTEEQPLPSPPITLLGNARYSGLSTDEKDTDSFPATNPGIRIPVLGFLSAKYIALFLLVAQTVGTIIALRISRTKSINEGRIPYLNTTAVFMSEIIKVFGSVGLLWMETENDAGKTLLTIKKTIIGRYAETLKVGFPALLYTIQNNLLFIALSNMSGALYQTTYQLKILSTAILSVIILKKQLLWHHWTSLLILTAGVILIQWPSEGTAGTSSSASLGGSVAIGLVAVLAACMTSGFAGVYFEKIVKSTGTSIWMRNIQLGLCGAVLAFLGAFAKDGAVIRTGGFFQGYDMWTWTAILLQAVGGLIVAAVLKYADNILKCFGNALAIVLSCVASILMHDFTPSAFFAVGGSFVIFAAYSYSSDVLPDLVKRFRKSGHNSVLLH